MTKQKLSRGSTPARVGRKAKVQRGKAKVKQISFLDRMIRAIPVSERGLQKGLTFILIAGVGVAGLALADTLGAGDMLKQGVAKMASDNGYRVRHLVVDGMEHVDESEVYAIVSDQNDRSMPLIELEDIRQQLTKLSWVEDARVTRRLPDTLLVEIQEREIAAVWENHGQYALIDDAGHVLEFVGSGSYPDLPKISGRDANHHAAELSTLIEAAPALKEQLKAASWVGNRRWDLHFRSGETLQLPEGDELARTALTKFARFDGVNRLLGRDLANFDMRDPKFMYVRKSAEQQSAAAIADSQAGEEG